MNLVPSRFACHSPRPSVCSPRSFKASAVFLVGRSALHIPFLHYQTPAARVPTLLQPIDSSCIRSLIATAAIIYCLDAPPPTERTLDEPFVTSQRPEVSEVLFNQDKETPTICCSCLVSLYGPCACCFSVNWLLTPAKHNARDSAERSRRLGYVDILLLLLHFLQSRLYMQDVCRAHH
jgi:hypothetical protein